MLVGYLLGGVQVPGHSGESDSMHFYERGLIKKKNLEIRSVFLQALPRFKVEWYKLVTGHC